MDTFKKMLDRWESKSQEAADRVEYTLTLRKHDLVKIKAFAEAYGLDEATITEGLLQSAVQEAEQAIPYEKGSQVIRIEEGEEVYADAGKTPAYVEAEKAISKALRE
ncbi:hypothetical protein V0R50_23835 [Pseudomonas sp. 148P]|uniref:Uncharacterized protein n=1 Tax=Pseudomonas ulcerans TaxID=3115852 RepID=A0ABU7HXR9_9PSED|nr:MULTISPECIES: hypothetical protein [unclassified Pseudomonas]MEE1922180.1 hypothetical protein [Pseudomonas sp. 147P]MEE1936269.1 hypothetical protein [Pseudomonas sp. 148P]